MKKFLNWLIYSSENPEQFSLTLKGLLVANSVLILAIIKIALGVEIPEEQFVQIVGIGVAGIGAVMFGLGLLRKFWNFGKTYFTKK